MTRVVRRRSTPFPQPPRDGVGSMGSWRDTEVDSTKNATRPRGRFGSHSTEDNKLPSRPEGRFGSHAAADTKLGSPGHTEPPVMLRRQANGNLKPMRWVSLHHHSTFSYLDGYQLPSAHVRRAQEINMGALAMTEHGNNDSHIKFELACEESGVKPIFGCEVYMPTGPKWYSDDAQTQRKHHLTILAKNDVGYRNLLQLITKSWKHFYHDPVVTWNDLVEHKEGLVILSGCSGSLLFCSGVGGKGIDPKDASYKRALRIASLFSRTFDDYYIEVQGFYELENTRQWAQMAPRIARAVGRRLVGTMDCHYTLLEESEVQQILHNLRPGKQQTLEDQARSWGYDVPLCAPPNDNSVYRRFRKVGLSHEDAIQALVSTEDIAEQCNVTLPKLPMVQFPVERATEGRYKDNVSYWRHLLKAGWRFRKLHTLPPSVQDVYRRQLKHEMELIESKDFVGYFLLVRAGVVYVKDVLGAPVGPARGSSAASIAAWLLRITEVDPLRGDFAGLLDFGRFISKDRWDLPDIDLDFPSEVRPKLREFYIELMGGDPDRVNNVGTFVKFKGKNSLDDVARVFHVPPFKVQTIKDFLIERSSGDLRASSTVADTIAQFEPARKAFEEHPELGKADLLEGNVKSFGVHAAALVLSNESVTSVAATMEREVPKGSGNKVTCVALDKKDAERQGLIKMDFLGLNTMSMLWNCLKWIGKDLHWLYQLRLDDPRIYALLQAVDVTGLFSMEGRAQRYVCTIIKPEKFSEIMDCNALCRPGPLHNGAARAYGEIKAGIQVQSAPHPALADITGKTQYQIVYQEQVLRLARIVGGFDDMGVATIRRLISRKEGEQAFNRSKDNFMEGVRTLHERTDYPPMSEELGSKIWGDMITSGAYAFNAPHCASYGLITYYTAHMKVYHPAAFYAAALYESVKDKDRTRQLLRDAYHHGVRVLKPSLQHSEENWTPVLDAKTPTIRAGFQSVNGIGEKSAATVGRWRDQRLKTGTLRSWDQITEIRGFGPATATKIREWIDQEDPFNAFALDDNIRIVKELLQRGELKDRKGNELPVPTHNASDLAADEHAGKALHVYWLGTFVDRNIRDLFEQNRARGNELDPAKTKDPHLAEWAMLTGEDEADQMLVKIDRWKWPHYKDAIFNCRMGKDLLLIQGVKPARSGVRSLTVKRLWVINPDD